MAGVRIEKDRKGNGATPSGATAELFDPRLLGLSDAERQKYRSDFLPIGVVNTLPQVRRTFEHIADLAESLAGEGQINPPMVARWTEGMLDNYLAVINLAWKTQISTDQLSPTIEEDGQPHYYVLIAGERRFRAAKHLVDHPCEDCSQRITKQQQSQERAPTCFDAHFPKGLEVRIGDSITAQEALTIQLAENTHERPPQEEEADWISRFYAVERQLIPGLTLTDFSKKVRRSPEVVRDALRFSMLSSETQQRVKDGIMSYGIAVQIGRLIDAGIERNWVEHYERLALASNMPAKEFEKIIGAFIRNTRDGNLEMFGDGLFSDLVDQPNGEKPKPPSIRHVVTREADQAFRGSASYLSLLNRLFEDGVLRPEDYPFKDRSVVYSLEHYIAVATRMLPFIAGTLPEEERERLAQELDAQKITVKALKQAFANE